MSERNPTELDGIELAIDALRTDLRTLVPAQVVSYNPLPGQTDLCDEAPVLM